MKKNLLLRGLVCLLLACGPKKRTHTDILPAAFNRPATSFLSLLPARDQQSQKHPTLFPLAAVYTNALPALPHAERPAGSIFSFLTSAIARIGNPRSYHLQDIAADDVRTNTTNLHHQSTVSSKGWWRIAAGVLMLAFAGVLGAMAVHKKQAASSPGDINGYRNDHPVNYKN